MVDLSKPLIPGCYIPGEFGPIWIFFRYEGVFRFCKKCGCVGHLREFCKYSDYVAARRIHARMEALRLKGGRGNNLPNGNVHGAAANRDNHDTNDNVEPEYIPINGVYQNGFMEHSNVVVVSSSPTHSTSNQGHESNSSSETDLTTPDSYHNPHTTRFRDENRAEMMAGDPYAPFTATQCASSSSLGGILFAAATQERYFADSSLSNSSGAGETGSKTGASRAGIYEEKSSSSHSSAYQPLIRGVTNDSSDSEEFRLPPVITSNEVDVTPQMLANLSLEDNSGAHILENGPPEFPKRPT
uniref:Zinc knuckle CX2CX4HX4C domain-containing protein n=1 Tax=Chenopodium quinoa TaxID=63459 RepID=A0A803MU90_CHEQI